MEEGSGKIVKRCEQVGKLFKWSQLGSAEITNGRPYR